jgi:hypothetical protein
MNNKLHIIIYLLFFSLFNILRIYKDIRNRAIFDFAEKKNRMSFPKVVNELLFSNVLKFGK